MPTPTRILLVEDNPSDRQFMDACLQDVGDGVELHHATRLEEAGFQLKKGHFELVIADLNLPDAEGLDTFFKVRALAADSAIVVMTGMDDPQLATRAVLAGAQDYLVKGDLNPRKVWQSMSNALQRHLQFQRVSGEAQDLRKKNSSLREMAFTDKLTGMSNRRGLAKSLDFGPDPRGRLRNGPTHALLVDVDDFKTVNDLFGYSLGDQALKDLGRRIRTLVRPPAIAARVGGDEFLVLAPLSDAGAAAGLAESIRAAAADVRVSSGQKAFRITASVGVAALARRPYSLEELLNLTQGALKLSKGGGKNRVCFVEEAPAQGAVPRLARLPFFDILGKGVAGYRFLLPGPADRPEAGPDSATEVRAMLRAAARDGGGLPCHLEISCLQLMRLNPEDLAFEGAPDRHGICLSIPEIPMSPLPTGLLAAIRRLQRAGWGIGLRGLDLGAHVWANLILLEPAVVTLNADLVKGVAADHERLRSLLRLRRALSGLGADIVAEGVESREDLNALEQVGVTYAAGPLLTGGR